MGKYCAAVRKLEDKFQGLEFHHIDRDHNIAVDVLSTLGSSRAKVPAGVYVQGLTRPSILHEEEDIILEQQVLSIETALDDWRVPILKHIADGDEPDDKAAPLRLICHSINYTVIGEDLYRRGTSGVLLKCINTSEGRSLLLEIHAGQCGSHAASRTLIGKAFKAGYYYPTVKQDAADLICRCE